MQLKALPGQPVCKHSVSMCFGRAPAPRAHSNSSRAGEGAPRLPLLGRAALDGGGRGSGVGGPASRPSLASRRGQGSGLGAGRLQVHSEFHAQPHFSCNSWLFLAARRSLGWVPWQRGQRSALGCQVGHLSLRPRVSGPASFKPSPRQDSPTRGATLVSALGPGFHQPVLPLVWLI